MDSTFALLVGLLATSALTAQTTLFEFHGDAAQDRIGTSMAALGDVDGDGYTDFATGGPSSLVSAHFDVLSGFDGRLIWRVSTILPGNFCTALANAGDADGDGIDDVVVGDPTVANGTGKAQLYSTATGALLHTWSGMDVGDAFGRSVSGAGDIDRDGRADVIIGSAANVLVEDMYAHVYSGRTGALIHAFTKRDGRFWDYGSEVGGGVDLNGDAFPDLLIASPRSMSQVIAYDGQTFAEIRAYTAGPGTSSGFAFSVLGDVTGDNVDDLLLGAFYQNRAWIVSGADGAIVWTLSGAQPRFGQHVGTAGDLNGDGTPDAAVGDIMDGSITMFSGATGGVLFVARHVPGLNHSLAATGLGDLTGDGRGEVLVGFPSQANGGTTGIAKVLSGAPMPVFAFGSGCGTPEPRLGSTTAVSGATAIVSLNAHANGLGALYVGVPLWRPLWPLGGICSVYVQPGLGLVALGIATDPSGAWSSGLAIPAGLPPDVQATLQAILVGTSTPLGFELSNGVRLTVQ